MRHEGSRKESLVKSVPGGRVRLGRGKKGHSGNRTANEGRVIRTSKRDVNSGKEGGMVFFPVQSAGLFGREPNCFPIAVSVIQERKSSNSRSPKGDRNPVLDPDFRQSIRGGK